MSDNLGPNQTRVLDPVDRSFDTVVYQRKKPPLSCEANFAESLSNGETSAVARASIPSGWDVVGRILDADNPGPDPYIPAPGDVITGSMVPANTFTLMGTNLGLNKDLAAWVNGWRVIVKGVNESGDDNTITLPAPPAISTRVDFVFLEVWRQLIGTQDTVWKNGNRQYQGANPANDLVDPAIGIETSLRVQLQYRVRVETAHIDEFPEGFTPDMYAQASAAVPLSCTLARFVPVPGDPGLWRSGYGDSASETTLGTVDGYTYAIPMFAVTRRNTNAYDPDDTPNGSGKSLADFLNGVASDRPDGKYNNWVTADDILDMRHLVAESRSLRDIAADTFDRLIKGRLRGVMAKSSTGGDVFGTVMVRVNATYDRPGAEHKNTLNIDNNGLRRAFSNAQIDQPDTLRVFTINDPYKSNSGSAWALNDTATVDLILTAYPVLATVTSLDGLWMTDSAGNATPITSNYGVTGIGTSSLVVTIQAGNGIIGTNNNLTLDLTLRLASGSTGGLSNGLSYLPERFLEARVRGQELPLALDVDGFKTRGITATVSHFPTDATNFDMLLNKGANPTEAWDFGHQMVHHVLGTGTSQILFPMTLNGYQILGVAWVKVSGVNRGTYTVIRNAGFSSDQYQVDVGSPAISNQADVELGLYTGTKFFTGNKQGCAITDSFEMRELLPIETANGLRTDFHVDASSFEILKIASSYNFAGLGGVYVNSTLTQLSTNNSILPTDATKSRATISFPVAPTAGARIDVPVLLKGGMATGEGAMFIYSNVPYQGTLDTTAVGTTLSVGPAVTTTAGSGRIANFTYTTGTASFFLSGTTVMGSGTKWLANARAGWTIRPASSPSGKDELRIVEVVDDNTLYVSSPANFSGSNVAYVITGWDVPAESPSNVVDRLPALDSVVDAQCWSEGISTAVSDPAATLFTRVVSEQQGAEGPLTVGVNPADRGRSQVLSNGPYGVGSDATSQHAVGMRFELLNSTGNDQRTYQAWAFDHDGVAKLMVMASESDGASASRYFDQNSGTDTVDLFEMPGRPLVTRRPA